MIQNKEMDLTSIVNLNELRDNAHQNAIEHGFWDDSPSDEHFLCLVISELMEAVEADRKNRHTDSSILPGFKAPGEYHNPESFQKFFNMYIKDTVEDELADAVIRLLDIAGAHNINILFTEHRINPTRTTENFTDNIYAIVSDLCEDVRISIGTAVRNGVYNIFWFAAGAGINLVKHIELKMEYNKTRAYMHGKKY